MDLIERLQAIGAQAERLSDHLSTEEATKMALVMPFIQALGYNVFNPQEVVPEFAADVHDRKDDKVDYAIVVDGAPSIFIECKCAGAKLEVKYAKQLQRYFNNVPSARVGVLTNGTEYRFYADLAEKNQMDKDPFIVLDIKEIRPRVAKELKRLVKDTFDLDGMLEAAEGLKYMRGILAELDKEWSAPSDDLVKLLAGRVYHGRQMRSSVVERFKPIVKHALDRFFTERVSNLMDRTKEAAERDAGLDVASTEAPETLPEGVVAKNGDVITTQEEVDGFHVVKAIVRRVVQADRVVMRDTKSYCGILLDDNNRKPICRLRFNGGTKYLAILDENKNEERIAIEDIDDIYDHADSLVATVERYLATS